MAIEFDKQKERQDIGKQIRDIRVAQKKTLEEVAEEAGVTRANLNNVELGKYSAGFDVLQKIAKALGCTIKVVG